MQGIITKHTVNTTGRNFSVSGAIDLRELKRYLLYWDQIIYPTMNGFGPNLDSLPNLKYLNDNGILVLEDVTVSPESIVPLNYKSNIGSISNIPIEFISLGLSVAQIEIAKQKLNKGEIWNIAQIGDSFQLPHCSSDSSSGIEFSLYNCLPIPEENMSFDDIINFRQNNKDNLNLLHRKLETFRRQIVESSDPHRNLVIAQKEILEQVNELAASMQTKKWSVSFETIKSYIQLSPNELTTLATGALVAHGLSIPPSLGVVGGYAVNLGIHVIGRAIDGYSNIPADLRDYIYLFKASKNKITKI